MSEEHTVSEIIKTLQSTYKPEEKILVMWWDRSLPYFEHTPSESVWERALERISDGALDYPSSLVWDTIAEEIDLIYKELGEKLN